MARGDSGRIVLEIDPSLKKSIYSALASEGITLKDWFLSNASHLLEDHNQMRFWPEQKSVALSRDLDVSFKEQTTSNPSDERK